MYKVAHNRSDQIRYPSYSLHTLLKLFLEKKSTREPQLNQPSVAYTRGILQLLLLIILNLKTKTVGVSVIRGG